MQFQHLQSLIVTGKNSYPTKLNAPLSQPPRRSAPYIEPTLRKDRDLFPTEKPSVVLISAVGATGKSALAQVLSDAGNMPLLDLSRHKPVGDNTISGLLTNSYETGQLGDVFGGLRDGTFGIVIDGLDEGRSKTTEQGFEAFLDDIASICIGSPRPSFLLLGRSDIVDSAWLHLASKGVSVGLLTIEPFDSEQAHRYIDRISQMDGTPHNPQYASARDAILKCLAAAFTSASVEDHQDSFLSFIGYPPVLDAVATVLNQERNFYRLENEIATTVSGDREIELLTKICAFVLEREQKDKVWGNILSTLCANVESSIAEHVKANGYGQEEQCARLLAYCLDKRAAIDLFEDAVLDMQFEEQLGTFLREHPFITGKKFRNAVFEAYALATAFFSGRIDYQDLAMDYVTQYRSTYHLVYICAKVAGSEPFPLQHIRALISAALDFRSRTSDVILDLDGAGFLDLKTKSLKRVRVEITVLAGLLDQIPVPLPRTFSFNAESASDDPINLGSTLADSFVYIPHRVSLSSATEIKLIAPLSVFCDELILEAPSLSVFGSPGTSDPVAMFDLTSLTSSLQSISLVGGRLDFLLEDPKGFGYPIVAHVKKLPEQAFDPDSKAKYLRLRKILTHFRSHSKGRLAKYADKVENERVAGNQVGTAILDRLLLDQVLTKEGKFYYIEPNRLHEHIGVNWPDLRSGVVNEKLLAYLRSIDVPF